MSKNEAMSREFSDELYGYLEQPIAILCMRYWYRGILREVGKNYCVLDPVRAVEVSGPATAQSTQTEDIIPSRVVLKLDVIELVCQPTWVANGFDQDSKKGAKPTTSTRSAR